MTRGPVPTDRNYLLPPVFRIKVDDETPFRPNLGTLCLPDLWLIISSRSPPPFPLLAFHRGFSSPQCTVKTHDSTIDFFLDGPLSARWDDGVFLVDRGSVGGERERGREREEIERRWRSSVEKIYDGETGRFIGLRELRLWREVFYLTKFTLDLFSLFSPFLVCVLSRRINRGMYEVCIDGTRRGQEPWAKQECWPRVFWLLNRCSNWAIQEAVDGFPLSLAP